MCAETGWPERAGPQGERRGVVATAQGMCRGCARRWRQSEHTVCQARTLTFDLCPRPVRAGKVSKPGGHSEVFILSLNPSVFSTFSWSVFNENRCFNENPHHLPFASGQSPKPYQGLQSPAWPCRPLPPLPH